MAQNKAKVWSSQYAFGLILSLAPKIEIKQNWYKEADGRERESKLRWFVQLSGSTATHFHNMHLDWLNNS